MARYRIVTDRFAGYEAQIWRWRWPFWVTLGFANTFFTVEQAETYIRRSAPRVVKHVIIDDEVET